MARAIKEIENEMQIVKGDEPAIKDIDTSSRAALWGAIIYVVAFIIHTLEVALDSFRGEVWRAIENNKPGTLSWYEEKARGFQLDYLLNKALVYDVVNAEAQIIKYAAAEENVNGGVTLKVSKEGGMLSDEELVKFKVYTGQIRFAGVRVDCISIPADTITLDASVFHNPLSSESVVRDSVNATTNSYFNNIGFNGVFRVNDLIQELRLLPGIFDIKMNKVEVNFTAVDITHVAPSGKFNYSSGESIIQLIQS